MSGRQISSSANRQQFTAKELVTREKNLKPCMTALEIGTQSRTSTGFHTRSAVTPMLLVRSPNYVINQGVQADHKS
jgi:hypothetical protein